MAGPYCDKQNMCPTKDWCLYDRYDHCDPALVVAKVERLWRLPVFLYMIATVQNKKVTEGIWIKQRRNATWYIFLLAAIATIYGQLWRLVSLSFHVIAEVSGSA